MSYNGERSVIESYILDNWEYTDPQLELSNNVNQTYSDVWVRATIQSGQTNQASLGDDPLYRAKGILYFQIFCKPNMGEGSSLEVADKIVSLFKSKRIGDILFFTPELHRVGVEANWYQINLTFKYQREEQ